MPGLDLSTPAFWALPPDARADAFRQLRQQPGLAFFPEPRPPSPKWPVGPGFYAVTRHADVVEASRNPRVFCSGRGATSINDLPAPMQEFFGSIIEMDDPRHARLRRLVSRGFTPRILAALESDVRRLAAAVVDDLLDAGGGDFVDLVAAPLPIRVICHMMGVPDAAFNDVLRCTNVILSQGDPDYVKPGITAADAYLSAAETLAGIMVELVDDRRRRPRDDVTSALVSDNADGDALTEPELASFFILLLVAGNETTRTAASHGLVALTEFGDQRHVWADGLDGITPSAIEELVRWSSPVVAMRRTLTCDAELGGQHLVEGDKVVLYYNSANRDEAVFDHPDGFDVRRDPNPHVGFGGPGPHFCLGAHLARLELAVLFKELLTRASEVRATGEADRLHSSFINGIKHLRCEA